MIGDIRRPVALISPLLGLAVLALLTAASCTQERAEGVRYAWYAPAVHPYFDEVRRGVEQFAADYGVEVTQRLGQDWTQDNQNENVSALAAQGHNAFSIFPSDIAGARGLYEELADFGITVVDFGQATIDPTPAVFYVGTDLKGAAETATGELIRVMGGRGRILNVLEVPGENTLLRQAGVEDVVAATPGVEILQTVGNIASIEEAIEKVQNAIAANLGEIDGIIATGYTPTVAIAELLTEYHEGGGDRIHFIGIDTDAVVLDAIRAGHIDGTMAQNPFAHGYVPMLLLKYLSEGWSPRDGAHVIDAGVVPVTIDNVDSYEHQVAALTQDIISRLESDFLAP